MKLRGALLLVMTATVCALSGLFTPQEAAASVDVINQWPTKPTIASNSNTAAVTGTYTVGAGTNRLMLVAVAAECTTAPSAVTVTYGGQALTAVVNNTGQANKIWVYRLNDAGIVAAGANKTLSVSLTGAGTITSIYASASVYNGVNQTTPITGSGANSKAAAGTTLALSIPLTSNAGLTGNTGLAVYVANWDGATTSTPATGYTEVRDYQGVNSSLAYCYKVTTGTTTEAPTSTGAAAVVAAAAGVSLNPVINTGTNYATVTTCGDCHGNPPDDGTARNTPPGLFPGAHGKHSGTNEGQYGQVCTVCHKNNGSNLAHSDGFKNITGTGVPRNTYGGTTNVAMTDVNYTETCTKSTCHSSGRTTIQYAASPVWSGTTTCLSCHGGRSTAGQNPPARSTSNFSMSTSHSQHLKYLTTEINCQTCHGKTAASHTALKDYTGALRHANGTKNVLFTNIAYGSYTSYKSTASGSSANTKVCTNTSCHGGKTRGAWAESAAINVDHTCSHCHGVSGTTVAQGNADRRLFAPGFRKKGTSTDQNYSSANRRVGSHFKHLSSAYMKNIKCNECHKVPSTPFSADTNHTLNTTRFNSGTLDFSQSSSARILIGVASGSTPAQLATFSGYTNGTAVKAATCSSVYCHGSRLKNGAAGGTYLKPYWNYSAMINYSNPNEACGRCHGLPPTSVSGSHTGTALTGANACSNCHATVMNTDGTIKNKALHINGQVDGGGHAYPYSGSIHKSLANPISNCTSCHTNVSGTYPVTRPAKPDCRSCHVIASPGTGCNTCHGRSTTGGVAGNYSAARPNGGIAGVFPNYSGSHTTHVIKAGLACTGCHNGYGSGSDKHGFSNTSGATYSRTNFKKMAFTVGGSPTYTRATMTCSTLSCHGTAVWGGRLTCLNCHNTVVTRTVGAYAGKTLGAVTAEFGLAYGHKKTGRVAVTAADCVVCHLEGVGGSTSTSATYHKNGTIDLRDPDIQGETPIKNLTDGAFTFGRFSTSFAAGSRSSAPAANNIAQVISIKFCLKCHDANGAQNTTARAGGTANMPWGGSTGYAAQTSTTLNGVPVANGTTNVFSQFSSGNSSVHPVRAARTKDFPTPARMVAPYNGFTRVGTAGTVTQGVVMNCFDCHNNYPTLNYLGKTGLLTLRTNAAHGTSGAAASGGMMRGTFYTATATLCTSCHSGYNVNGQHGAGSAMASNTGRTDEGFNGQCSNCHGSKTTAPTTAPARPIPAADFHGYNNRYTGVLWPTINARPTAFIRGWSGTAYHRARGLAGTSGYAVGTAQCGTGTCPTGGSVGDGSNRNYIPGGTY